MSDKKRRSSTTEKSSGDTFRGGYPAGKSPKGGLRPPPASISRVKTSSAK